MFTTRHPEIEIVPQPQFDENGVAREGGAIKTNMIHRMKLCNVSCEKPRWVDKLTGVSDVMTPNMARLRNLTYCSPFYVDVEHRVFEVAEDGSEQEMEGGETRYESLPFCELPVMLKSEYCWLSNCTERELCDYSECPYDNGGYFIVNGSEKVIV